MDQKKKKGKKQYLQMTLLVVLVSAIFIFFFRPWEYSVTEEEATEATEPTESIGGLMDFSNRDYGELDHNIKEILSKSEEVIETPFLSGGKNPEEGFNSSGFVQYVYQEATGIRMPRIAAHQQDLGDSIPVRDLYPGDLVFFESQTIMSGIYIGHGEFITVSQSNGVEKLTLAEDTFWSENYTGAKRLTEEEAKSLHPGTYEDHEHPAVVAAIKYLDTPYSFGGNSLDAFDCSFFIQEIFRESSDVFLPRVTNDQFKMGNSIDRDNIQPGDVIFFSGVDLDEEDTRIEWDVTHVGIYLGNNFMIHASRTEAMTQISYINDYWDDAFTGVKRYDDLTLAGEYPVVQEAARHLGNKELNTSGYVSLVYKKTFDIDLPDTATAQWNSGEEIHRNELKIGDLLFFEGANSYLSAIYIGHDQAMFASGSSGVTTRHLDHDEFFSDNYLGARRYY